MKKYLVIGNPIEHSLSPKLHNYWFEKNNIDANYERRKIDKSEIQKIINEIKDNKLDGINVTVPFKADVIPFLDTLSVEAQITKSDLCNPPSFSSKSVSPVGTPTIP